MTFQFDFESAKKQTSLGGTTSQGVSEKPTISSQPKAPSGGFDFGAGVFALTDPASPGIVIADKLGHKRGFRAIV